MHIHTIQMMPSMSKANFLHTMREQFIYLDILFFNQRPRFFLIFLFAFPFFYVFLPFLIYSLVLIFHCNNIALLLLQPSRVYGGDTTATTTVMASMESNENDTNTTTMVTPFSYMKNIHKPHSLSQIEKKNVIPFLDLKKFVTPFLFQ